MESSKLNKYNKSLLINQSYNYWNCSLKKKIGDFLEYFSTRSSDTKYNMDDHKKFVEEIIENYKLNSGDINHKMSLKFSDIFATFLHWTFSELRKDTIDNESVTSLENNIKLIINGLDFILSSEYLYSSICINNPSIIGDLVCLAINNKISLNIRCSIAYYILQLITYKVAGDISIYCLKLRYTLIKVSELKLLWTVSMDTHPVLKSTSITEPYILSHNFSHLKIASKLNKDTIILFTSYILELFATILHYDRYITSQGLLEYCLDIVNGPYINKLFGLSLCEYDNLSIPASLILRSIILYSNEEQIKFILGEIKKNGMILLFFAALFTPLSNKILIDEEINSVDTKLLDKWILNTQIISILCQHDSQIMNFLYRIFPVKFTSILKNVRFSSVTNGNVKNSNKLLWLPIQCNWYTTNSYIEPIKEFKYQNKISKYIESIYLNANLVNKSGYCSETSRLDSFNEVCTTNEGWNLCNIKDYLNLLLNYSISILNSSLIKGYELKEIYRKLQTINKQISSEVSNPNDKVKYCNGSKIFYEELFFSTNNKKYKTSYYPNFVWYIFWDLCYNNYDDQIDLIWNENVKKDIQYCLVNEYERIETYNNLSYIWNINNFYPSIPSISKELKIADSVYVRLLLPTLFYLKKYIGIFSQKSNKEDNSDFFIICNEVYKKKCHFIGYMYGCNISKSSEIGTINPNTVLPIKLNFYEEDYSQLSVKFVRHKDKNNAVKVIENIIKNRINYILGNLMEIKKVYFCNETIKVNQINKSKKEYTEDKKVGIGDSYISNQFGEWEILVDLENTTGGYNDNIVLDERLQKALNKSKLPYIQCIETTQKIRYIFESIYQRITIENNPAIKTYLLCNYICLIINFCEFITEEQIVAHLPYMMLMISPTKSYDIDIKYEECQIIYVIHLMLSLNKKARNHFLSLGGIQLIIHHIAELQICYSFSKQTSIYNSIKVSDNDTEDNELSEVLYRLYISEAYYEYYMNKSRKLTVDRPELINLKLIIYSHQKDLGNKNFFICNSDDYIKSRNIEIFLLYPPFNILTQSKGIYLLNSISSKTSSINCDHDQYMKYMDDYKLPVPNFPIRQDSVLQSSNFTLTNTSDFSNSSSPFCSTPNNHINHNNITEMSTDRVEYPNFLEYLDKNILNNIKMDGSIRNTINSSIKHSPLLYWLITVNNCINISDEWVSYLISNNDLIFQLIKLLLVKLTSVSEYQYYHMYWIINIIDKLINKSPIIIINIVNNFGIEMLLFALLRFKSISVYNEEIYIDSDNISCDIVNIEQGLIYLLKNYVKVLNNLVKVEYLNKNKFGSTSLKFIDSIVIDKYDELNYIHFPVCSKYKCICGKIDCPKKQITHEYQISNNKEINIIENIYDQEYSNLMDKYCVIKYGLGTFYLTKYIPLSLIQLLLMDNTDENYCIKSFHKVINCNIHCPTIKWSITDRINVLNHISNIIHPYSLRLDSDHCLLLPCNIIEYKENLNIINKKTLMNEELYIYGYYIVEMSNFSTDFCIQNIYPEIQKRFHKSNNNYLEMNKIFEIWKSVSIKQCIKLMDIIHLSPDGLPQLFVEYLISKNYDIENIKSEYGIIYKEMWNLLNGNFSYYFTLYIKNEDIDEENILFNYLTNIIKLQHSLLLCGISFFINYGIKMECKDISNDCNKSYRDLFEIKNSQVCNTLYTSHLSGFYLLSKIIDDKNDNERIRQLYYNIFKVLNLILFYKISNNVDTEIPICKSIFHQCIKILLKYELKKNKEKVSGKYSNKDYFEEINKKSHKSDFIYINPYYLFINWNYDNEEKYEIDNINVLFANIYIIYILIILNFYNYNKALNIFCIFDEENNEKYQKVLFQDILKKSCILFEYYNENEISVLLLWSLMLRFLQIFFLKSSFRHMAISYGIVPILLSNLKEIKSTYHKKLKIFINEKNLLIAEVLGSILGIPSLYILELIKRYNIKYDQITYECYCIYTGILTPSLCNILSYNSHGLFLDDLQIIKEKSSLTLMSRKAEFEKIKSESYIKIKDDYYSNRISLQVFLDILIMNNTVSNNIIWTEDMYLYLINWCIKESKYILNKILDNSSDFECNVWHKINEILNIFEDNENSYKNTYGKILRESKIFSTINSQYKFEDDIYIYGTYIHYFTYCNNNSNINRIIKCINCNGIYNVRNMCRIIQISNPRKLCYNICKKLRSKKDILNLNCDSDKKLSEYNQNSTLYIENNHEEYLHDYIYCIYKLFKLMNYNNNDDNDNNDNNDNDNNNNDIIIIETLLSYMPKLNVFVNIIDKPKVSNILLNPKLDISYYIYDILINILVNEQKTINIDIINFTKYFFYRWIISVQDLFIEDLNNEYNNGNINYKVINIINKILKILINEISSKNIIETNNNIQDIGKDLVIFIIIVLFWYDRLIYLNNKNIKQNFFDDNYIIECKEIVLSLIYILKSIILINKKYYDLLTFILYPLRSNIGLKKQKYKIADYKKNNTYNLSNNKIKRCFIECYEDNDIESNIKQLCQSIEYYNIFINEELPKIFDNIIFSDTPETFLNWFISEKEDLIIVWNQYIKKDIISNIIMSLKEQDTENFFNNSDSQDWIEKYKIFYYCSRINGIRRVNGIYLDYYFKLQNNECLVNQSEKSVKCIEMDYLLLLYLINRLNRIINKLITEENKICNLGDNKVPPLLKIIMNMIQITLVSINDLIFNIQNINKNFDNNQKQTKILFWKYLLGYDTLLYILNDNKIYSQDEEYLVDYQLNSDIFNIYKYSFINNELSFYGNTHPYLRNNDSIISLMKYQKSSDTLSTNTNINVNQDNNQSIHNIHNTYNNLNNNIEYPWYIFSKKYDNIIGVKFLNMLIHLLFYSRVSTIEIYEYIWNLISKIMKSFYSTVSIENKNNTYNYAIDLNLDIISIILGSIINLSNNDNNNFISILYGLFMFGKFLKDSLDINKNKYKRILDIQREILDVILYFKETLKYSFQFKISMNYISKAFVRILLYELTNYSIFKLKNIKKLCIQNGEIEYLKLISELNIKDETRESKEIYNKESDFDDLYIYIKIFNILIVLLKELGNIEIIINNLDDTSTCISNNTIMKGGIYTVLDILILLYGNEVVKFTEIEYENAEIYNSLSNNETRIDILSRISDNLLININEDLEILGIKKVNIIIDNNEISKSDIGDYLIKENNVKYNEVDDVNIYNSKCNCKEYKKITDKLKSSYKLNDEVKDEIENSDLIYNDIDLIDETILDPFEFATDYWSIQKVETNI